MDFPIIDLLDEQACYDFLLRLLHPGGLPCPRCGRTEAFLVHRYVREPVFDHRCPDCGRVFNLWSGTIFQGTHRPPSQIVLILRGIAQGTPTAKLARELKCSRRHLLDLRHRIQELGLLNQPRPPLPDSCMDRGHG
jgi:transposase-like protein